MSWRIVNGYVEHFYTARNARPNSPTYRREMKAARAYWRRMSEYERRWVVEYHAGHVSEKRLREAVSRDKRRHACNECIGIHTHENMGRAALKAGRDRRRRSRRRRYR